MLQQQHLFGPHSSLMASANFVGKIPLSKCVGIVFYGACIISKVDNCIWIIVSRAINHITSNKELLFNIQPLPISYLIIFPNGLQRQSSMH